MWAYKLVLSFEEAKESNLHELHVQSARLQKILFASVHYVHVCVHTEQIVPIVESRHTCTCRTTHAWPPNYWLLHVDVLHAVQRRVLFAITCLHPCLTCTLFGLRSIPYVDMYIKACTPDP